MIGSFDSSFIVFQALRLVCVILVDVMTSSHLLFFSPSFCQSVCFPDFIVPRHKGCLNSCSCMLHIGFLIGVRILFDIL